MYALVDCNNFYASCERLFRPDLHHKPIIVLSNNDGCVIARSNEAKQLGIKMGEPFFQIKALCKQHHVHVFSSNFPLYGDLSTRVMSIIKKAWANTEIYSIDEAFLDLHTLAPHQQHSFCEDLHQIILKCTGIPTSIGLGTTKTLAKLSNHLCKKELHIPVFNIQNQDHWLKRIAVGDVWGVGRQWQKKLIAMGIHTAFDLANIKIQHPKNNWNVMLLRTIMELNGRSCLYTTPKASKSILSSKSFMTMQTEYDVVAQALSFHCARACEKLRQESLMARSLLVFIHTNRHRQDLPTHHPSIKLKLMHPTDDIRVITTKAKYCLKKIFKSGIHYKKVGVQLSDLISKNGPIQYDLFDAVSEEAQIKTEQFMSVFDGINKKFGRHTVKLAASGRGQSNQTHSKMHSPCYTTRWTELAIVKNLT